MEKKPSVESVVPTAEQVNMAKSLSPIAFVSSSSAPALLMHGLDDTIVPPDGSQRFAEKLRESGVPVELILIPGARHAFILPKYTATEEGVVNAILNVDRFLIKKGYLSGEPKLTISPSPAWIPKSRPTAQHSPHPTPH